MPQSPNKITQFWQELKRRKVSRVITVYAAAAFVILELVSIIADPLKLPEWFLTAVIVLLCIGFVIAVILSWIYDVHPEGGIVKTEPVEKVIEEDIPKSSNSWKIASYASFVVIVALIIFNIIPRSRQLEDIAMLEKSIAVLPFTNMSGDEEQDYFCYGIAEDILNDLTHLGNLRVVARTSSFSFKDKDQDIRDIGIKLGVHTILEGSVRKAGNKLRITAQLVNVVDGFSLWSEHYDRDITDVFAIQNEIAKSIVQALEIKLNNREKQELEKVNTQIVKAYDFYVKGRDYYHQSHRSSTKYAIELFTKAIQIDEDYALAYSGLADSYSQYYTYYDKSEEYLKQALSTSQKALELDPGLAEAHSSRGIALTQNKQYNEGEIEFKTAIQLDPKLFNAYYEYARACRMQGNFKQAVDLFEKATQVQPENYDAALFLSTAYYDLNMEDEWKKANENALKIVRIHLEFNPDDARALYLGAGNLIQAGETEEALQWMSKAVSINPNETAVLYNASCIYSMLRKVDKALDYFEQAIESGFTSREWIDNDTDLDPIRDHPRFQKALKKLN